MSSAAKGLWLGALATLSGCIEPFQNPSEFEHQRYLCEPETAAEWDAAVATCYRQWLSWAQPGPGVRPQPCAGVASMRGTLQGKAVVFTDEHLASTSFHRADVGGLTFLDRVEGSGSSPYFLFSLGLTSLGGRQSEPLRRDLTWSTTADAVAAGQRFQDPLAAGELRIENGTESVGFVALDDSGTLSIEKQEAKEVAGRFSGGFHTTTTDHLEGCFHLFALSIGRSFY